MKVNTQDFVFLFFHWIKGIKSILPNTESIEEYLIKLSTNT
jgi:hypothetical protein